MATKTFQIEIKADVDPEREAILVNMIRQAADQLHTQAMLLQPGRRAPQVSISSSDLFETGVEIKRNITE
jgi:hypothetical protein